MSCLYAHACNSQSTRAHACSTHPITTALCGTHLLNHLGCCYAWSMQLMSVDWYFVTEKCLCTAFTILWARPTPNLTPVKLGVLRSLTSQCSLLHFSMGLEHVVQFGYLRLHFFNGVIGGSGSLQVLFFSRSRVLRTTYFIPSVRPLFFSSPQCTWSG